MIPRSMAIAECRCTGQSTTKVNALCLAAANATCAPLVSSVAVPHETHALIDFLTTATGFGVTSGFTGVDTGAGTANTVGVTKPAVVAEVVSALLVALTPDRSILPVTVPVATLDVAAPATALLPEELASHATSGNTRAAADNAQALLSMFLARAVNPANAQRPGCDCVRQVESLIADPVSIAQPQVPVHVRLKTIGVNLRDDFCINNCSSFAT